MEVLSFVEVEYKIPAGLLRPNDSLKKLAEPVSTRNPLKWLVYQTRAGDRENELSLQLAKRLARSGTSATWSRVETFDDLIRAWCGEAPGKGDRVR